MPGYITVYIILYYATVLLYLVQKITSSLHACNNLYFSAPKFVGEISYMDEYVYQDNWKSYRKVTISKSQVCELSSTVLLFNIKSFSHWKQFPS